jgi:hypothetical protein
MAEALLTAGKIATALQVSPKKIKDAIAKAGIEPDSVKGACKYYTPASVDKIKAALE